MGIMHVRMQGGFPNVVRSLLQMGADVYLLNSDGLTAEEVASPKCLLLLRHWCRYCLLCVAFMEALFEISCSYVPSGQTRSGQFERYVFLWRFSSTIQSSNPHLQARHLNQSLYTTQSPAFSLFIFPVAVFKFKFTAVMITNHHVR